MCHPSSPLSLVSFPLSPALPLVGRLSSVPLPHVVSPFRGPPPLPPLPPPSSLHLSSCALVSHHSELFVLPHQSPTVTRHIEIECINISIYHIILSTLSSKTSLIYPLCILTDTYSIPKIETLNNADFLEDCDGEQL